MNQEIYNIAVTPNSAYVNYLVVFFQSLIVDSNPDKKFHIFVIYNQLKEDEIELLRNFVESRGSMIDFIYIDGEKYQVFPEMERLTVETYFRLEVQDVIPRDVHRLLYLDVDMMVCKDIDELYHMDFEDNYLIACGFSPRCEKGPEFNAGMLLMNLDKIRAEYSFQRYVEEGKKLGMNFYADQGLLNHLFGDCGTKYVEKQLYNFTSPFYRKYKSEVDAQGFSMEDIVIIHFAGPGIRPWQAYFDEQDKRLLEEKNLRDISAASGFILDDIYMELQRRWWECASKTNVYRNLLNDMYRKKSEIWAAILDKTIHTKDYEFGYRIMKILRKVTGKQ